MSLFEGQLDMFAGDPFGSANPKKPAPPKEPEPTPGRFDWEVEKELLLLLAEEDAERWVAEIEWAKEESESPEDFMDRMGF